MPLCVPIYDETPAVIGVGPSTVPWPRCINPCCGSTVQLQIRTRAAYGRAILCAAHLSGGVYHTQREFEQETFLYKTEPGPDTLVRTCTHRENYDAGPAAIATSGDPGEVIDCEGSDPVITDEPEDCYDGEGGEWDYSVPQVPTATYSGDTAVVDDLKDAAISALAWGEWSEWATMAEITANGDDGGLASIDHYLAEAGIGQSGSGAGASATATRYESELRILGSWAVTLCVASGSGVLADFSLDYISLVPGVPHAFGVDPPSSTEGWVTEAKVLRCACPKRFAPS